MIFQFASTSGTSAIRASRQVAKAKPFIARAPAAKPVSTRHVAAQCAATTGNTYKEAVSKEVMVKGEVSQFPASPGVYAVVDKEGTLQYIGLSRKMSASIANHMHEVPDLTHSIKFASMPDGTRDALSATWKAWVEEVVAETGGIPPGNAPGETKWQSRAVRPAKAEIRLTAGKAIDGSLEDLVDQVVKTNKIVAFVKGTRTAPQCGFSHKMITILNGTRKDFEVVNVLDDIHNPGLREVIKTYSQWPTIPQLYAGGEFVGGTDIVIEMSENGELTTLLAKI